MFTVISWCNNDYKYLAEGIQADCRQWGYSFHLYDIDEYYPNLVSAWCNHPKIIRQGVLDHGTVLFVDVECRIVQAIPKHWQAPLVSVRQPVQPFWITYNTGTVMADESCLPWLDAWIRIIERWQMGSMPDDAYIYWPNDICDELAFNAAVSALDVELNTADLEYIDRNTKAEIVRGLWKNEHTIVQHPTLHHWPKVTDHKESKKLFVQNFPGNLAEIETLFSSTQEKVVRDGWVFDSREQLYAPQMFENHLRSWLAENVQLTSAHR